MAKAKENSQQKQYVILGGLLLVMLAVAGKALFNSSAKTAGATVVASSPTTGIGSNDDTPQTPQLSPLTVDWSTDFSRDPFDLEHLLPKAIVNSVDQTQQPPQPPKPTAAELQAQAFKTLQVQATVTGNKPSALINGQMWHLGESIQGFKLKEIHSRKIVVEKDGVDITLEM